MADMVRLTWTWEMPRSRNSSGIGSCSGRPEKTSREVGAMVRYSSASCRAQAANNPTQARRIRLFRFMMSSFHKLRYHW